ncbi:hypothetical protein HYH03_018103 [Edaphochlamys debaryana]|uniref:Tryptophan synthase beta chain-like PALP domain-containing protein n=1 Tax=Edaphochlamys debaryana TaxID=47281 RepID=A0A835XHS7_9CHLO|nr:hypothetical protein HYH03_018103 [Edaphochlamys debaryana]|eukprot:KAG2483023.1 hypothetical protein HYH03_018103 [Edaphochlamys debaryana]
MDGSLRPPTTTEELLAVIQAKGWNTAVFRGVLPAPQTSLSSHAALNGGHSGPAPAQPVLVAGAAVAGPEGACCRVSHLVAREAVVAYGRIRPFARWTPLEPSPWLSGLASQQDGAVRAGSGGGEGRGGGCHAWLKLESEQHSGSFKVRGALNKLLSLNPDQLSRGVFTASTGNHALAVLYACSALQEAGAGGATAAAPQAPATVVAAEADAREAGVPGAVRPSLRPILYVPETASPYKLRKLSSLGGELRPTGTDCLEAESAARAAAEAAGATYVSPYNDMDVIAGQGTIALELLASRRRGELDAVFVPVGGGGLIAGVASVLKAADPSIRVIGCQPAASDVMARSVLAGSIQPELSAEADDPSYAYGTLSDATAGGVESDSLTLQPCADCVDEWIAVREDEIAAALVGLLREHSKLVEGAAAVGLAAFRRLAPSLEGRHAVGVCCGGNIGLEALRRAMDMADA